MYLRQETLQNLANSSYDGVRTAQAAHNDDDPLVWLHRPLGTLVLTGLLTSLWQAVPHEYKQHARIADTAQTVHTYEPRTSHHTKIAHKTYQSPIAPHSHAQHKPVSWLPEHTALPKSPYVRHDHKMAQTSPSDANKNQPPISSAQPAPKMTLKAPYKPLLLQVGKHKISLKPHVLRAFQKADFPLKNLIVTCTRESHCNTKAVNEDTQAGGLFQFLLSTASETIHKNKKQFPEASDLVTKIVMQRGSEGHPLRITYTPKDTDSEKMLEKLLLNPDFNTRLYVAYTKPNIKHFKEKMHVSSVSQSALLLMNNLGLHGAITYMKGLEEAPHKLASDFFKAHANVYGSKIGEQNPSLIRKNGHPLTMLESFQALGKEFGQIKIVSKPTAHTHPSNENLHADTARHNEPT